MALCPETEIDDRMTMKNMANHIECEDAKAASAAFVCVFSRRCKEEQIAVTTGLAFYEIAAL